MKPLICLDVPIYFEKHSDHPATAHPNFFKWVPSRTSELACCKGSEDVDMSSAYLISENRCSSKSLAQMLGES